MPIFAKDIVREPLYAIIPYFNPWRWKSRVKHTERALRHFHDSGAVIIFVEVAFNRRESLFAESGLHGTVANCPILGSEFRHQYVQLRTKDELWLKENAINIGAQHIPRHDWQQVCWLDSDVHFLRPNWVGECIQQLQHYKFLQMFSHARDLAPNYEMLPVTGSSDPRNGMAFFKAWRDKLLYSDLKEIESDLSTLRGDVAKALAEFEHGGYPPSIGPTWPGLAWACTREAFDSVGGLFDVSVWGGSDYDMAHALIERAAYIHPNAHGAYRRLLLEWEDRCRHHIRRNIGTMEGSILHHWHGKKRERQYTTKRLLMNETSFDPLRFLKRDYQGLWQLHDDGSENFIHFRDQMRKIAKERNEDSIDL